MTATRIRDEFPVRYTGVLAGILLVSFVYAVFLWQVDAWILIVREVLEIGLILFVVYLFYRLVLAVERIADGQ